MTDAVTMRRLFGVGLAACALALGACGDDDDDGGSAQTTPAATVPEGGSQQQAPQNVEPASITIDAVEKGGLSFSESAMQAAAGPVLITMRNPKGNKLPHAIELEGNGIEQEGQTVQPGGTSRVSVPDLKPGEYEIYCPVGDHKAEGMEATLTVTNS